MDVWKMPGRLNSGDVGRQKGEDHFPARPTDRFVSLTGFAFSYCLLVGTFFTADCLSEEKRDGTLGLLFLTDLHSYNVVLGKWVAASLAGFHGLLAMLPALGLPCFWAA